MLLMRETMTSGIASELPEFKGKLKDVNVYSTSLSISCKVKSTDDFKDYVSECKKMGFTIDADETNTSFEGFNETGYRLHTYVYSDKTMNISLNAPDEYSDMTWPTVGLASKLPKPANFSGKGKTVNDSSDNFTVYISQMSFDEYKDYVSECMEAGFIVDYDKTDKRFDARNPDNVSLSVSYEGGNVVRIDAEIEEPETTTTAPESTTAAPETTTSAPETTTAAPGTTDKLADDIQAAIEPKADEWEEKIDSIADDVENKLDSWLSGLGGATTTKSAEQTEPQKPADDTPANGIRPDFKKAMDAYEAYVDEYCEFMKKYDADSSNLTLLMEYGKMVSKLNEMTDAYDEWESEDLTDEELKYYIDVQARVSKKLIDVTG